MAVKDLSHMGKGTHVRVPERWHDGPKCKVVVVSGTGGNGVKLYCEHCRVLADAQAVCNKETPKQSEVQSQ